MFFDLSGRVGAALSWLAPLGALITVLVLWLAYRLLRTVQAQSIVLEALARSEAETRQEAVDAGEAKATFLASTSHEIRPARTIPRSHHDRVDPCRIRLGRAAREMGFRARDDQARARTGIRPAPLSRRKISSARVRSISG